MPFTNCDYFLFYEFTNICFLLKNFFTKETSVNLTSNPKYAFL